mmetsp:Transcript_19949/g.32877  ORF Transcript_19949/g.32877 Transcript_19949/m.32877 type:complete len:209 (+) Transcript_19949:38-664(+)
MLRYQKKTFLPGPTSVCTCLWVYKRLIVPLCLQRNRVIDFSACSSNRSKRNPVYGAAITIKQDFHAFFNQLPSFGFCHVFPPKAAQNRDGQVQTKASCNKVRLIRSANFISGAKKRRAICYTTNYNIVPQWVHLSTSVIQNTGQTTPYFVTSVFNSVRNTMIFKLQLFKNLFYVLKVTIIPISANQCTFPSAYNTTNVGKPRKRSIGT